MTGVKIGTLDLSWMDRAACRGKDLELFFPDEPRLPHLPDPDVAAKRICAGCPVREECLTYALGKPETEGVWGGMSAHERRFSRRRRL